MQHHASVKVTTCPDRGDAREDGLCGAGDQAPAAVWVRAVEPLLIVAVNVDGTREDARPDEVGGVEMGVGDDDGSEAALGVDLPSVSQSRRL